MTLNNGNTCPNCRTITENGKYCSNCGHQVQNITNDNSASTSAKITSINLKLFIGKNADYYIEKWDKADNQARFAGWNWAAFFLGVFWLAYRKMYRYMFIFILLSILVGSLPIGGSAYTPLFWMILLGLFGNTLYYKHTKQKVSIVKQQYQSTKEMETNLKKIGGIKWLAIGLPLLIFFAYGAIIGFISSIDKRLAEEPTSQYTLDSVSNKQDKSSVPSINQNKINLGDYLPTKENSRIEIVVLLDNGDVLNTFVKTTEKVIEKNGLKEVHVSKYSDFLANTTQEIYYFEPNKIKFWESLDDLDSLLIDLSSEKWTRLTHDDGNITAEIISFNEEIDTPAGTFTDCIVVLSTGDDGMVYAIEAYAPKLGKIYTEFFDGTKQVLYDYQY